MKEYIIEVAWKQIVTDIDTVSAESATEAMEVAVARRDNVNRYAEEGWPSPCHYAMVVDGAGGEDEVGDEMFFGEQAIQTENKECADKVNHPAHYASGEIECIDAIHAQLGDEGFIAYCQGNVAKYLWRWRQKGGVEDLRKAKVYLKWMTKTAKKVDRESR